MRGWAGNCYTRRPLSRVSLRVLMFSALLLSVYRIHALNSAETSFLRSSAGTVVLGPEDALELVFKPAATGVHSGGPSVAPGKELPATPEFRAWLLEPGQEVPAASETSNGRALVLPSTTRPGEWLVHLRGLRAPRSGPGAPPAWDLLLRWPEGQERLKGALAFRSGQPDVVLLLDGSLSMGRNDPQRLRVEAARAFVTLGRSSGGIGQVALVQFDDKVRVLLPLTPLAAGAAFERAFESIRESGLTDIDGGIRKSIETLRGTAGQSAGAIVLLTDGKQEPGEYANAHHLARDAGVVIHTLALGNSADRKLLKRIAEDTGGTFSDAARGQDLLRLYAAIAGRIAGGKTILSRVLPAAGGRAAFPVDGACRSLVVAVSAGPSDGGLLVLLDPGGRAEESSAQAHPLQYRQEPSVGAWAAAWTPTVGKAGSAGGEERGGRDARATLEASAHTALFPLFFRARPDAQGTVELDPDDPRIALSFAEGAISPGLARVEVALEGPGNPKPLAVPLFDDGAHGDGAAGDGVYAGALPDPEQFPLPPDAAGLLRACVTGRRGSGEEFRREVSARWMVRRSGLRALLTSGPLDLGSCWAGSEVDAEITLRVRGPGGVLSVRSEALPALADLSRGLRILSAPRTLATRQAGRAALRLEIPEGLAPGRYGGAVGFTLSGAGPGEAGLGAEASAQVPWRVEVKIPELAVAPASIDLGLLAPGAQTTRNLRVATRGGRVTLRPLGLQALPADAGPLELLLEKPALRSVHASWPLALDSGARSILRVAPEGAELLLDFKLAPNARAGRLERVLFLRDLAGRELGSIPITASVRPLWLEAPDSTAFGALEPGDAVTRAVQWKVRDFQGDAAQQSAGIAQAPSPGTGKSAPPAHAWTSHVRVRSDDPRLAQAEWQPGAGAGEGKLRIQVLATAFAGPVQGWLEVQAGPALLLRRWTAQVVLPQLRLDPPAIDFGPLLGGQGRRAMVRVCVLGAHPVKLETALVAPPSKPLLRHIALPAETLVLSGEASGVTLLPGGETTFSLDLRVADSAQDGVYEARVSVESRLGRQLLPVTFRVVAPVPHPPFHVAPAEVVLRVEDGAEPETAKLVITSHIDDALPLALRLEPGPGSARAAAEFPLPGAAPGPFRTLTVPGRGEAELLVRALPDAMDGEECFVILEGGGERQRVDVVLKRVQAAPGKGAAGASAAGEFFDWLRFLFLLLLLLLILAIRGLVRKSWIRYGAYACAFHAALMFMVVPAQTIVGALPAAVELTLLASQEEMGYELSPEQARRMQELRSGFEQSADGKPPAAAAAPAALATGPKVELPEEKSGAAGTPAAPLAEAEFAEAATPDPHAFAAPAEARREEPAARLEQALAAEALAADRPRAPEPAPAAPIPAPAAAPLAAPRAPAPVLPPSAAPADHAPAKATSTVELSKATVREVREVAPATTERATRPTRERPALEDLPLSAEVLEKPVSRPPVLAANPATHPAPASAPALPRPFTLASSSEQLLRVPEAPRSALGTSSAARPQAATDGSALAPAATEISGASALAAHRTGGGARRTPGSRASEALDGALDAGPGVRTGTGKAPASSSALREARDAGPSAPRGVPGGLLPSTSTTGIGPGVTEVDAIGSGLTGAISAGPAATGKGGALEELGQGIAVAGGERLASGTGGSGRNPTGQARGDAPLDLGLPGKSSGTASPPGKDSKAGGESTGRHLPEGSGWAGRGLGAGPGGTTLAMLPEEQRAPAAPEGRGGQARAQAGLAAAWVEQTARLSTRQLERGAGVRGERPLWGPASASALKLTLGLARHSGDWDSSPTALHHLATAFKERSGLPEVEVRVRTLALTEPKALAACHLLLITSNDPILFARAELEGLKAYVEGGGMLWVNDSSASGDERFDHAFRRELSASLPAWRLERMEPAHAFFRSAYNLSRGYKGYKVPPGDKYRVEYIEGCEVDGKAGRGGVVYTRNDYADGLEIDPRHVAGRISLTDLTPDEMLEGSLRFGINLLAYALGAQAPRLPPPPEGAAQFEKLYRYRGPELKPFDSFEQALQDDGRPIWQAEEWGNPAQAGTLLTGEGRVMKVVFKGGTKAKAAVGRKVELDLSGAKSIILDLHSSLAHGFNVALLFQALPAGTGFESRPVFVRPGWNRNLRFPLELDDFKSSRSGWKGYDSAFKPRAEIVRIAVLLYNLEEDGEALIDSLRIEK